MSIYVKFWGTRGSIPTPDRRTRVYGGNTSCVEIRVDGTLFVCDAGTGIRELGRELIAAGKSPVVGHIFFSHAHWDHIQGFPFFEPAYNPANTFYVYSPVEGDSKMYDLLSGQMGSDYFPINFADLGAKIESRNFDQANEQVPGIRISYMTQNHPGGSYAFVFEKDGHKIVYATDSELDKFLPDLQATNGDNAWMPRQLPTEYIELAKGADLLIADSQYTDEEYEQKVGWGHPRATTAIDWAIRAGVKNVALFHHDPMHSDEDIDNKVTICRERARMRGSNLVVLGAREGLELKFD